MKLDRAKIIWKPAEWQRLAARAAVLVVCFEKVSSNICATLKRETKRFEMTHGGSKNLLDRLTRFAVEGK